MYVHASILPQTPLPSRPPHSIEFPVLYRRSLLVLHFEYSSAYMSGTHPVHLRLVIRKLTPNSLLASDIQTGEEKSILPILAFRFLFFNDEDSLLGCISFSSTSRSVFFLLNSGIPSVLAGNLNPFQEQSPPVLPGRGKLLLP